MLTIFGVANFSTEQTAAIMLMVTSAITLAGMAFKQGQTGDPATTVPLNVANEAVTVALNTPTPPMFTRGEVHTILLEALRQQQVEAATKGAPTP